MSAAIQELVRSKFGKNTCFVCFLQFVDMKVDVLSMKVDTAELVIPFLHCLAFRIEIWYGISIFDLVTSLLMLEIFIIIHPWPISSHHKKDRHPS